MTFAAAPVRDMQEVAESHCLKRNIDSNYGIHKKKYNFYIQLIKPG